MLLQIFLHEVKIREQILDLVIYMLITLAGPEQVEDHRTWFHGYQLKIVSVKYFKVFTYL